MKIKYFHETDTLYIEFRPGPVAETKDLDEDTEVGVDVAGSICAITVEHASRHADLPALDYEQVPKRTRVMKLLAAGKRIAERRKRMKNLGPR